MKIFLICPVRDITPEYLDIIKQQVENIESQGHKVYWPYRDTNQNDKTGLNICKQNRQAILEADEIVIIWNGKSEGSIFDLGMAFAMKKRIIPLIGYMLPPTPHKSFPSMIWDWEENGPE